MVGVVGMLAFLLVLRLGLAALRGVVEGDFEHDPLDDTGTPTAPASTPPDPFG